MPREWFDAAVDRLGLRAASVPKLAAEFAVSLEAAALRLTESCDQPCAVGFFEFDVRPSARESNGAPGWARGAERAYRASRVFRGSGFPFMFPEGKSVPEDSVIHRASFWTMELGGVEEFALGNRRERLRLTAFPLHRDGIVTGPPRVCAVFRRG